MPDNLPAANPENEGGLPAKWNAFEEGGAFHYQTSLPEATEQDRLRTLALIEGESVAGGDMIGSVFLLQNYIAHTVQLQDPESGEVIDAIRMVLTCDGQEPISFVSIGVLKSLDRICKVLRRVPPFDPPVKVKLRQIAGRNGRRTFKLEPVTE